MKVFISYRNGLTNDLVGRLEDRLRGALGGDSVFRDSSSLVPGSDFRVQLGAMLTMSDVVLAVIGDDWGGSDRLHEESDFVRVELLTAFELGKPVIPVLVARTPMPLASNLPGALRPLSGLQAFRLDSARDTDFTEQIQRLVRHLEGRRRRSPSRRALFAVVGVAVVAAALLVWRASVPDRPNSPERPNPSDSPVAPVGMAGGPAAPMVRDRIASPDIEASDHAAVSIRYGNVNVAAAGAAGAGPAPEQH